MRNQPQLAALGVACLLSTLGANPARGGAVYVPLPGSLTVGSTPYSAQVVVINGAAQQKTAETLFLAEDSDGTDRGGATPSPVLVPGKRTVLIAPGAEAGLLEIHGPADLDYAARLIAPGSPGALGVEIPVLGSRDRIDGGETTVIPGFAAKGTRTSDLLIVNLDHDPSTCFVQFVKADGAQALPKATLTFEPLSMRRFADVFSSLGAGVDLAEAQARVSCDQSFHAFGLARDSATGEIATLWPATAGTSTLVPPGQGPECADGATCFAAAGLVHKPTKANPVGRAAFAAPAGTVDRFRLTMDVTVDDFFAADPAAKHLLYWFVVNNNKDMMGLLYFRGPNEYGALARHGMGLTHPQKKTLRAKSFKAKVGTTYRIVNDYDMKGHIYRITVTNLDTGVVDATMTGTPNVASYKMPGNAKILVDMGFPEGLIVDEVPSYDWLYQNLLVEVFYQ